MREERTLAQRVQMAVVCAAIFGSGVAARVLTHDAYSAVDLGLEGSLVMGMLGGYVTGLFAGVLISIPAMFNGELMSMPLLAAVGRAGRPAARRRAGQGSHLEIFAFPGFEPLANGPQARPAPARLQPALRPGDSRCPN